MTIPVICLDKNKDKVIAGLASWKEGQVKIRALSLSKWTCIDRARFLSSVFLRAIRANLDVTEVSALLDPSKPEENNFNLYIDAISQEDPLTFATKHGNFEVVKFLVQHFKLKSADINREDARDDLNPMEIALSRRDTEIFGFFIEHCSRESETISAATSLPVLLSNDIAQSPVPPEDQSRVNTVGTVINSKLY